MPGVLEQPVIEPAVEFDSTPYLFSTDEFYRMLEAEIFPRESRVGLWNGRIYEKMAKTQAHAVTSMNATMILVRALPPGWCLSTENPVTLTQNMAPLPDMFILRGQPNDYLTRRPEASDVGLIAEFSFSSLKYDQGPKLEAYARAGVVVYWIMNLKDLVIHASTDPIPDEGRYANSTTFAPGQSIPLRLDGVQIALVPVSDLLPIARSV